jgi:ABC-type multidrug transport system permease subunit
MDTIDLIPVAFVVGTLAISICYLLVEFAKARKV